jgi:hypothetical protein
MPPPPRDYARLAAHLTAARCDALARDGYVVVDDFWGRDWARALRDELRALAAAGGLAPNRTLFAQPAGGPPLLFAKPHIFEADLHARELQARFGDSLPEFGAWFAGSAGAFCAALGDALPALSLKGGDAGRTVKLQHNTGGGSFALHYDNPGAPNARALTVLVYLNEVRSLSCSVNEPCLTRALTRTPAARAGLAARRRRRAGAVALPAARGGAAAAVRQSRALSQRPNAAPHRAQRAAPPAAGGDDVVRRPRRERAARRGAAPAAVRHAGRARHRGAAARLGHAARRVARHV